MKNTTSIPAELNLAESLRSFKEKIKTILKLEELGACQVCNEYLCLKGCGKFARLSETLQDEDVALDLLTHDSRKS